MQHQGRQHQTTLTILTLCLPTFLGQKRCYRWVSFLSLCKTSSSAHPLQLPVSITYKVNSRVNHSNNQLELKFLNKAKLLKSKGGFLRNHGNPSGPATGKMQLLVVLMIYSILKTIDRVGQKCKLSLEQVCVSFTWSSLGGTAPFFPKLSFFLYLS